MTHYLLEGTSAVPCNDLPGWAIAFEKMDRRVAQDVVGEVRVSTVFLGLDHSFGGPIPLLFETMVFGGPMDQDQRRYTFWDDAVKGHSEVLKLVMEAGQ